MATKKPETEANVTAKTEDDGVWVMIPYVEGQDPEKTVIINGHITKIKKGRQVKVSRPVASILARSNQMMMIAWENQQKLKDQSMDL